MARSLNDFRAIISARGNLVIDASPWTARELSALAGLTVSSNTTVTFRNVDGKTARELALIAAAAPGRVTFEL